MLSALWFRMRFYRKRPIFIRNLWDFWLYLHKFFLFYHGCLVHRSYLSFIFFYLTLLTTPYFILLSYSSSISMQTFLIVLSMKAFYFWVSHLLFFFYFNIFFLCKSHITLFYYCLVLRMNSNRESFSLDSYWRCCLFYSLWVCKILRACSILFFKVSLYLLLLYLKLRISYCLF